MFKHGDRIHFVDASMEELFGIGIVRDKVPHDEDLPPNYFAVEWPNHQQGWCCVVYQESARTSGTFEKVNEL